MGILGENGEEIKQKEGKKTPHRGKQYSHTRRKGGQEVKGAKWRLKET